jgi:thiamine-phosphate pyrophosphorylase
MTTDVLRIIDANFNRAREALRVMEEYARFVLDDAALSESIKRERHDLSETVGRFSVDEAPNGHSEGFDRSEPRAFARPDEPTASRRPQVTNALAFHRDIEGDVGRAVAVGSEYRRASVLDVAIAAAKRLAEALRAIEEYGKMVNVVPAAAIERLRYRGYELERRLMMTARASERFGNVRVYLIVTEALCRGDWLATAEQALRGGAGCIQLREKNLPDAELLERAKRLASRCREHEALFIVNDRPDIAVLSGADGVHVGQDDLPVSAVRRLVPPTTLVGVSTHTVEQARAAAAQAPDYIAVGPMFRSSTKPRERIPGPELLRDARRITSIPLIAIGGIDSQRAEAVLDAAGGRCGLAVCRAVVSASDAKGACAALDRAVQSFRSPVRI